MMNTPHRDPYVRRVLELDELRVGPVTITHDGVGNAGIWIDAGYSRPLVSIFATEHQTGIGLYAPHNRDGACEVALLIDENGAGRIQLCDNQGGPAVSLGIDDLKKLIYGGK